MRKRNTKGLVMAYVKTNKIINKRAILLGLMLFVCKGAFSQVQLIKSTSTSSTSIDVPFTYSIQINCPSTVGTCNNVVVYDPLPPSVDYIGASAPTGNVQSIAYEASNHRVVITMNPTLNGTTDDIQLSVAFPWDTYVGTVASNTAYDSPSNTNPSNTVTTTATNGLSPPSYYDGVEVWKGGDSTSSPGDGVSYEFNFGNYSEFNDLTNFSIEDVFDPNFRLYIVDNVSYSTPGAALINYQLFYRTNLNGTYQAWPGGTGNLSTKVWRGIDELTLAGNEYVTAIKFDYTDPIPGGGNYIRWRNGNIPGGIAGWFTNNVTPDVDIIENCITASGDWSGSSSGPAFINYVNSTSPSGACMETIIRNPRAIFLGEKQQVNYQSGYIPGDTIEFEVLYGPQGNSGIDLINPVIIDMLPPELQYVSSVAEEGWGDPFNGPIPPVSPSVISNYNGTGKTLVKYDFTGHTIPHNGTGEGAILKIRIKAKVISGVPSGEYKNEAYYLSSSPNPIYWNYWQSSSFHGLVPDVEDVDGDNNTSEMIQKADTEFNVAFPSGAGLESIKWVKGSNDSEYTRYPLIGSSSPGGTADYKLVVKNLGGVAMKDIKVIDILPFVGDKGVVDLSNRNSQWRPFLIDTVFAANNNIQVYYSTVGNPCRDELTPGIPTPCDNPNWSLTAPADVTFTQSLKFDFGSLVMQPGDSVVLEWPMRIPFTTPPTGQTAWNSFGYIATRSDNDVVLLASEPIKVGVAVNATAPAVLGDFIWEDLNANGVQDETNTGINDLRVDLYKALGSTPSPTTDPLIGFTLTSNNASGEPGYYIFSNLEAGDYYIVTELPSGMVVTSKDTTLANDQTDSDGSLAIVNSNQVTISSIVTLGGLETNLSLDQGFYSPCSNTLTASASSNAPRCVGSTLELYGSSNSGTVFSWTGPNGFSSDLENPNINSISSATAGVYTLLVNDGTACWTSATTNVVINLNPSLSTTTIPVGCFGANTGSATVFATGSPSPFSYSWSSSPVQNTQTASGLLSGNYVVSVTDSSGCASTSNVIITEPSEVIPSAIPIAALCNGGNGSAILSATGGDLVYSFSSSGGIVSGDTLVAPAGTYTITATDGNGCTGTVSVAIDEPSAPLSHSLSQTNILCFGDSTGTIDLSVNGGTPNYSYLWNIGDTTQDLSNLTAGTYTVVITDSNGCTNSASVAITQPSLGLTSTFSQINVDCFGNSTGSIDLIPSGGVFPFTYLWSNGDTTQDISTLSAGFYTVIINDDNGCTAIDSITISEPLALTNSLLKTDISCNNSDDGTIDLTISGGTLPYSYAWSNGDTTSNLIDLSIGTYSVTITDGNGCTTTASTEITEPGTLVVTPTVTNVSCFGTSTGGIDIVVIGGNGNYRFDWADIPGGNNFQNRSFIPADTYVVTVRDNKGCNSGAIIVEVTEPAAALSVTNDFQSNILCYGDSTGSVEVNGSGGTIPYTYDWIDLTGVNNIKNRSSLPVGTYSVIVRDSNGCATSPLNVNITEPAELTLAVASQTIALCAGDNTGNINITTTGGVLPYVYDWSDIIGSDNGRDRTGLSAGSYSVVVSDSNSCTTSLSIIINLTPDVETPIFTMGASTSRCQGGDIVSYIATANNATNIVYSLDAGSALQGNTINPSTGDLSYNAAWVGTSIITATALGCNGPQVATHTVTVNPSVTIPVFALGATSTRCQGSGLVAYSATVSNEISLKYYLDAFSLVAGNQIDSLTGEVTYVSGWSGTSLITAIAEGCNGPLSAIHNVTITPTVGLPVFDLGPVSVRCQEGITSFFSANSSNSTGMSYSIDALSLNAGITISSSTGAVNFPQNWLGQSVITATATGCNGPRNSTHSVTTTYVEAFDDVAAGTSGSPIIIPVLDNDLGAVDPLTVTIKHEPVFGFLQIDSDGVITYLPNGNYFGTDQFTYTVCSNENNLCCTEAVVNITIEEGIDDPCSEATKSKTYYLPFPEDSFFLRNALWAAGRVSYLSDTVRTIVSIKIPYPGNIITYDHWEDGYESDITAPIQATTEIWGDGNISNGWAPGYPDDNIPAGGYIFIDNQFVYNARNPNIIAFDGKDKILSSNDVAISKISGDAGSATGSNNFDVQNVKTNVVDLTRFGKFFVIPFGEDNTLGGTSAFKYTGLFARASQNNTVINLDYDADGNVDVTSPNLMEGEVWFYDGSSSTPGDSTLDINQVNDIKSGASLTSSNDFGVDVIFGGIDNYGTRNMALLPGSYYGDVYFSPAHTTLASAPVYAFFTNSLASDININWNEGTGTSGSFTIPAKGSAYLDLNQNAAYRFASTNGEAYTAVAVFDADASGSAFDWSFNMIPESRLSSFASVAWAPGSNNGSGNFNPVWVTAPTNTTLYVKYDGDLSASSATISPCGTAYDIAVNINALESYKILDPTDNDQTGLAVYTCDGTKIAAIWGQNPAGAVTGSPSMDVGYVLEPRCLSQLIIANDDSKDTEPNTPVIIDIQSNDYGFLCTPDVNSVSTLGLLQPLNGTTLINSDGSITYTPNLGFQGIDLFEYRLCSEEYPGICDIATVRIRISDCLASPSENIMRGRVFVESQPDNATYDGEMGAAGVKVDLYLDSNCNGIADLGESVVESTISDLSGVYQFSSKNGNNAKDNFDPVAGTSGNDGGLNWDNNWAELNDDNNFISGDIRIIQDASIGGLGNAIRLSGSSNAINRTFSFQDANGAKLKFSYRRQGLNNQSESVNVTLNGTTVFVLNDGGSVGTDVNYTNVVIPLALGDVNPNGANQLQFTTNGSTSTDDYFWVDNIELTYWKNPPICFVTKVDASLNPAYSASLLDTQSASFIVLGVCDKDNNLGVLPHIIANDDNQNVGMDIPTIIDILNNDVVGKPDPSSVFTTGMSTQAANGSVQPNLDGTVTYIPNSGFIGIDQFEYRVCSLEDPMVCDSALVTVNIVCSSTPFVNEVKGTIFQDQNGNAIFENLENGFANIDVDLFQDNNGNGIIDIGDSNLMTSSSNSFGSYAFAISPPTTSLSYLDNFSVSTVSNQSSGSTNWTNDFWTKIGEVGSFGLNDIQINSATGLRVTSSGGVQKGVYRIANINNAVAANLSFNYVESGLDLVVGDYVDVQIASSPNPSSWHTLVRLTGANGNQSGTLNYDITDFISSATTVRFISSSNPSFTTSDIVYFDNVRIDYQEPQPSNYIVRLSQPLPVGYALTTPLPTPAGVHTASFSTSGEGSCANDFGLSVTDLAIIKTVNNITPNVGDEVEFTIVAINKGPIATSGVEVIDDFPAGYTLTGVSLSTGTWIYPVWNIGNMSNGQTDTLLITATVNPVGPYMNTATITGSQPDPNPDDNDSTAITYPNKVIDLVIEKVVNDLVPNVGDTVTFTLTASNLGPSTGTNVVVNDILPSGYTFISASTSAGTWLAPNWTLDSLMLNEEQTLTITALVLASGNYLNTTTIDGFETDIDSTNNNSSASTIPQIADLSVMVEASDSITVVGDNITIYVKLYNEGPDTARNVVLNNFVPNGFTDLTNITGGGVYSSDTIKWSGLTIAPNDSLVFTYQVSMSLTGVGIDYTTHSEVLASDQFDPDSTPNNGIVTEDDYDTKLIVVYEEPPIAINDTARVHFMGNPAVLNIIDNDSLSNGLSISDLNEITIDLDLFTAGIQDSLIVLGEGSFKYDTLSGEVTFTPEVGFETDPTPIDYLLIENQTTLDSVATIYIFGRNPGISIVKTQIGGPALITSPETLYYNIIVTNTGNENLTGVVVIDTLPDGNVATLGTLNESLIANNILDVSETWTYPVSYTVTQADIDEGIDLVNLAVVSTDSLPIPQDDTASTPILQQPSLTIVKTQVGGQNPVTTIGNIDYEVVISNSGNTSLTGVTVVDTLPNGSAGVLSPVVESGISNGILDTLETWTYTISYEATISDIYRGLDLINTAFVWSDSLPNPISDTATTPVILPDTLLLTLNKVDISCFELNDGSINAVVTGGTLPYSYNWIGAGKPDTSYIDSLAIGLFVLEVTDANGITVIDSASIAQPNEIIPVLAVSSPVCLGDSIHLTVSGADSYSWIGPSGFSNTANDTTFKSTINSAGTYLVTASTSDGCFVMDSIEVIMNPLPVITGITISPEICEGDAIVMDVANTNVSFLWTGPNGFSSTLKNPIIDSALLASEGLYGITIVDSNGCAKSETRTVFVNPLPSTLTLGTSSSQAEGVVALDNGKITISGDLNGLLFQINEGVVFDELTATALAVVPSDGILVDDLEAVATATPYLVRIQNQNGCIFDYVVILDPTTLVCPIEICVPYEINKIN